MNLARAHSVDLQNTGSRPIRRRPRQLANAAPGVVEQLEGRRLLTFATVVSYPTGNSPMATAAGDLNGDGHVDIVVADQSANTVSVMLGAGNGAFGPKIDYATGATPTGVVLADFNGDGKLDIATTNFGANSVSILLGNGDGTFRPRTDLSLGTTPVSLTARDFNGNGKVDLAVATEDISNDYVNMLKGNGDGTFQAPISTVSDSAPKGAGVTLKNFDTIKSGDFNGDGKPDLVVVNKRTPSARAAA